jgi:hypothetical protein
VGSVSGVQVRFQSRAPPTAKNLVWRITPGVLKGEWIDPAATPSLKVVAPDRGSTTWAVSSFELRYGADVTDFPDTVPPDLLDELFPPRGDPSKRSGK